MRNEEEIIISQAFDKPIDLRGYLKFILPFVLFGLFLLLALGINAIFN